MVQARGWWWLRPAGLGLIGAAALAGHALFGGAWRPDTAVHAPLAYVLGFALFYAGCAGAALLVMGRRLFDPVAVSPRWSHYADHRRRAALTRAFPFSGDQWSSDGGGPATAVTSAAETGSA